MDEESRLLAIRTCVALCDTLGSSIISSVRVRLVIPCPITQGISSKRLSSSAELNPKHATGLQLVSTLAATCTWLFRIMFHVYSPWGSMSQCTLGQKPNQVDLRVRYPVTPRKRAHLCDTVSCLASLSLQPEPFKDPAWDMQSTTYRRSYILRSQRGLIVQSGHERRDCSSSRLAKNKHPAPLTFNHCVHNQTQ